MKWSQSLKNIIGIGLLSACAVLGNGCGSAASQEILENGVMLEKNGKSAEAMAEYDRAIELDPRNISAYYYRALLRQKQGNPDGALADYNKMIEIQPGSSEPYCGRGAIYENRGQRDKAIADYTAALENDPMNALAYVRRAKAYEAQREYKKALDDAQKAKGLGAAITDDFLRQLESNAAKQK